jgi:hypothetical protein
MKIIQSRSIVKFSAITLLALMPLGFSTSVMAKPARRSYVAPFIPIGWSLEKEVSGDLNDDGRNDIALQIAEPGSSGNQPKYEQKRMLRIVMSTPSGWKQVASTSQIFLCRGCAGMLGSDNGSHIQLQIQDGILIVKQLAGSRSAIQIIHRFWLDRTSQKFVRIGEDLNSYDRANGNAIEDSRNFLTGQRTVKEYRGRKDRSGKDLIRTQELKVSRQLTPIEALDIEAIRKTAIELP